MRKFWIGLAIFGGFILVLWVVGRLTGMLQFYNIPVGSNEPTINVGDKIFASHLKEPRLLDFICFEHVDPFENKKAIYVFRLCGMPGDKLQITDGELYVNGRRIDQDLNLKFTYHLHNADFAKIYDELQEGDATPISEDSVVAFLPTKLLKEKSVPAKREFSNLTDGIQEKYGHLWTQDNFGPYTVPADHYFVLGDNRQAAMDSRYIGPIHKDKVVGVVLK